MKTRQFIAFLVLAVFVINSFVFCILSVYRQYEAKLEIKELLKHQLPESSISTLCLHESEFNALEIFDESEFFYKGEMYDLISIEKNGNTHILKAISDKKEKSAIKVMAGLNEENQPNKKNNSSLLFIPLFNEVNEIALNFFSETNLIQSPFDNNYASALIKLNSPPPKTV